MGAWRKQPWLPAVLEWRLKAQALAWFCCLFLPSLAVCSALLFLPACPFPSLLLLPAHPRAAALPTGAPVLTACHHSPVWAQPGPWSPPRC